MGTILSTAVIRGDLARCKILLNSGVDVHAQNEDGNSALMLASQNGFLKISKLLLEHNASPSEKKINMMAKQL